MAETPPGAHFCITRSLSGMSNTVITGKPGYVYLLCNSCNKSFYQKSGKQEDLKGLEETPCPYLKYVW